MKLVNEDEELLALAAQGLISLPEKAAGYPPDFFTAPLPKVKVDVLKLLREDREER